MATSMCEIDTGIIPPSNPKSILPFAPVGIQTAGGWSYYAPTVDFPRRRAGIKSSTREGLVQPTSKGWLNLTHGLRVVRADSDRPTLDGNAAGNSAFMPQWQGDLLPQDNLPPLSGNKIRSET